MSLCAWNGCDRRPQWKVSMLVWAEGCTAENSVPFEIHSSYIVCTEHRQDGQKVDIIDARLKRRVAAQLRADHKPPADWRTVQWKYVPLPGSQLN